MQEDNTLFELAKLNPNEETKTKLNRDVAAIMDFVSQLKAQDTSSITPLFHPHTAQGHFRPDIAMEADITEELAAIAPFFEDDLFWVPQVLESEQ